MINKIMKFFKSKPQDPPVHEIFKGDFQNKVFEDKNGNRFMVTCGGWSSFHCLCLDKDNTPIIETRIDPRTKEVYTINKSRTIGYYSKGFKLTK